MVIQFLQDRIRICYESKIETLERILVFCQCLDSFHDALGPALEAAKRGATILHEKGDTGFAETFGAWQAQVEGMRIMAKLESTISERVRQLFTVGAADLGQLIRKERHFEKKLREDIAAIFIDEFLKLRYQARSPEGKLLVSRKRRAYHGCGLLHYLGIYSPSLAPDTPFPDFLVDGGSEIDAYKKKLREARKYLGEKDVAYLIAPYPEGKGNLPES
jgi:hypothetical protein